MRSAKEYSGLTHRIGPMVFSFYRRFCTRRLKIKEKHLFKYPEKDQFNEIHTELWKTIADRIVTNEGGVYIDNLGYFCNVVDPRQKFVRRKHSVKDVFTDGYRYSTILLDGYNSKKFERYYFCIDDIFPFLKKNIQYLLKRGIRYRFLYNEIEFRNKMNEPWKFPKWIFPNEN